MPVFSLQLRFLNIFAVTFVAAFFLSAELPKASYVQGRVDVVDLSKDGFEPNTIDINQTLSRDLLVATGVKGRLESVSDRNYWRLGSDTMGIWYSDTSFWLQSGSILFCSQSIQEIQFSSLECNATFKGRGTIIIEATGNGGFKFIPLEGKGILTTAKGGSKEILGGRMLLVLGKPTYFGDAYDIDLMLLLRSSRLINAFPSTIPTFKKIGLAIYVQEINLKGKYDALIGDATTNENLQIWKFGKNTGVEPPNNRRSESKKGFFKGFFSKD